MLLGNSTTQHRSIFKSFVLYETKLIACFAKQQRNSPGTVVRKMLGGALGMFFLELTARKFGQSSHFKGGKRLQLQNNDENIFFFLKPHIRLLRFLFCVFAKFSAENCRKVA